MYNLNVIKNVTRNTILADNFEEVNSFFGNARGLIGKKTDTLLLKTRFGIHTFFMNSPIDVLILSPNNTVVSLKKNLKPNNIFFWNPNSSKVLELESGRIENSRTGIGDKLQFS